MSVLVDSSIWIDFFRDKKRPEKIDYLIAEDLVVVNDLILAELVPAFKLRRRHKYIRLLQSTRRLLLDINWSELIDMQTTCLRKGINNVGIPDLIIAQHAIQNELKLYSFDKHFKLIAKHFPLDLF